MPACRVAAWRSPRSGQNKNIVVYEGLVEGGELKADKPVDAYWFDIDPDYIKANRKKCVARCPFPAAASHCGCLAAVFWRPSAPVNEL